MPKSSSIVEVQVDGAGPLSDLQRTVLAEAERSQSVTSYRWLQVVGPLVAMANLPLGAVLMVGGAACEALTEQKDLRNARMPDEWLGQVASQAGLSQEGLASMLKNRPSVRPFVCTTRRMKSGSAIRSRNSCTSPAV